MESQSSQPSLLRQAIATRSPAALAAAAAAVAATTGNGPPASPYLPAELMMYPTQRLVQPNVHLATCVFPNQVSVPVGRQRPSQFCSCIYGASHTCSIHHAPIAYGQASSSFVAPTTSTAAAASIPPGMADLPAAVSSSGHSAMQDFSTAETARRETRLPPTYQPIRTSMRLKRGAPATSLPSQVQNALDEASRPKLSRLDSSREIQTVTSETLQQPPAVPLPSQETPLPASTSQLVTGPVPSTHSACSLCHGPCPDSRCLHCQCPPFCATLHTARATIVQTAASRNNFILPTAPNATGLPHIFPVPGPPPAPAFLPSNMPLEQLHNTLRIRQQQMQQMHINNAVNNHYRLTYLTNGQLYVPVRNTPLGFEALLVNVGGHPEFLLDRPLDRHHMFATPATEPQPIGCSLQDIEKHSEKLQFVKDCEIPETEQERCIVCQCELETGEEVRHLSCQHQFHVDCIDRWLGYNKKCPVCRLDIDQPKETAKDSVWIE